MKFFDWLCSFIGSPVEHTIEWLDSLVEEIEIWWSDLIESVIQNSTNGIIDGVSVIVVCYAIYCACRVMCSGSNDEKFSEYISKSMIAALAYFFAKCGGRIILNYIGV